MPCAANGLDPGGETGWAIDAALGVTRSLSRPQVSDDNPFSEAQFKTLKYYLGFPGRFDNVAVATTFCRSFFPW